MNAPAVAARPCRLLMPYESRARQTRRLLARGRLACTILLGALSPTFSWSVVLQEITPWPDARIHQIRVAPDGRRLAVLASRGETPANHFPTDLVSVCLLEIGDEYHAVHPAQEPDPELGWPRAVVGPMHWSPDSLRLMYTLKADPSDGGLATAMVMDIETGAATSAGEYSLTIGRRGRTRPFWVGDDGHEIGSVAISEVYALHATDRASGAGRPGSPFVVMANSLWLRPRGGRQAYLLDPREMPYRSGFWGIRVAPNGLVAAVQAGKPNTPGVSSGGRLYLVDSREGQVAPVRHFSAHQPDLSSLRWSPDSTYVVYRSQKENGSHGLWITHAPEEWHE